MFLTSNVYDVDCLVAGVGDEEETRGGGARERHPATPVIIVYELELHRRRRGAAPHGLQKCQPGARAGTGTCTCTRTTAAWQGKHTQRVVGAVGGHQQAQGGARRDANS
jgi:hypothetical protein